MHLTATLHDSGCWTRESFFARLACLIPGIAFQLHSMSQFAMTGPVQDLDGVASGAQCCKRFIIEASSVI